MRAKKLFVIFLAAVCMLAVALSCVFIFAIEEINVEFAVGEQTDVSAVSQTIDEYTGKNLLFADLDEIKNDLKKYPYFKVESIKKNYPNGIDITLSERVEVYWFESDGVYYTLDKTGFILKKEDQKPSDENRIQLVFDENVNFTSLKVGEVVKTDKDELVNCVFSMASKVRLTDCINKIQVFSKPEQDVTFYTYTGVKITIRDADESGDEKARVAFDFYDKLDDYSKAFNEIIGYYNEYLGKIEADWSKNVGGPDA